MTAIAIACFFLCTADCHIEKMILPVKVWLQDSGAPSERASVDPECHCYGGSNRFIVIACKDWFFSYSLNQALRSQCE